MTGVMAALEVEERGTEPSRNLAQQRCDPAFRQGPWSVLVRRPDGSLARNGAVVTFPVSQPTPGRAVDISTDAGTVTGIATGRAVTWPVSGAFARVQGDVGETELMALASRTSIAAGRPVVTVPAGYAVVSVGPYRSPAVHEVGYDSRILGVEATRKVSWVHTGVASGLGYEDQLFAASARGAGTVQDRPAVVSGIRQGTAMLCWEPAPGVVAFVSYGGDAPFTDDAVTAMQRLANQTRALTPADWQAMRPVTVGQVNDRGAPGPWPEAADGP